MEPWLLADAQNSNQKAQWELAASVMHEVIHQSLPGGPWVHESPDYAMVPFPWAYRGRTPVYVSEPFDRLNLSWFSLKWSVGLGELGTHV